jgi:hypothetical protein
VAGSLKAFEKYAVRADNVSELHLKAIRLLHLSIEETLSPTFRI